MMDNNNDQDLKLIELVQVCSLTKNFKRLSGAIFILMGNHLNEISIKLNVKPWKYNKDDRISHHMSLINSIFIKNVNIPIFPYKTIEVITECESLFFRSKGNLTSGAVKLLINEYYELRKLRVPSLHEIIEEENIINNASTGILSFFSNSTNKKQDNTDNLNPLIMQKIREREITLQKREGPQSDDERLREAIILKKFKVSLDSNRRDKTVISGALKDNISYQISMESLFGYLLIGAIIALASLGTVILLEMTMILNSSKQINLLGLLAFGGVAVLILVYVKIFKKGGALTGK